MFKRVFSFFISLVIFTIGYVYAANVTYTVNYATNSEFNSISLKNIKLQVLLYASNIPRGMMVVQTDDKQSFTFDNLYDDSLVLEVVCILDQPKNIRCQGISKKGTTDILLNCKSLSKK